MPCVSPFGPRATEGRCRKTHAQPHSHLASSSRVRSSLRAFVRVRGDVRALTHTSCVCVCACARERVHCFVRECTRARLEGVEAACASNRIFHHARARGPGRRRGRSSARRRTPAAVAQPARTCPRTAPVPAPVSALSPPRPARSRLSTARHSLQSPTAAAAAEAAAAAAAAAAHPRARRRRSPPLMPRERSSPTMVSLRAAGGPAFSAARPGAGPGFNTPPQCDGQAAQGGKSDSSGSSDRTCERWSWRRSSSTTSWLSAPPSRGRRSLAATSKVSRTER